MPASYQFTPRESNEKVADKLTYVDGVMCAYLGTEPLPNDFGPWYMFAVESYLMVLVQQGGFQIEARHMEVIEKAVDDTYVKDPRRAAYIKRFMRFVFRQWHFESWRSFN